MTQQFAVGPDGQPVYTNDPDVPKLRAARAKLAALVRKRQLTPAAASDLLGAFANGLLRSRGERAVDDAKS